MEPRWEPRGQTNTIRVLISFVSDPIAHVPTRRPFPTRRRSAPGHRGPDRRAARGQAASGADGRDRLGQDVHDGQRHPERAAADAGDVAQQDAGRPALLRVQGVLPAQRRPLLRQLLRLLSARGVHPAARHLHRERRLDQPADRAAAAGRHQRAGEPPRRDRRGQRLVHLRPGLARGLSGDDGRPGRRADGRSRRGARQAGQYPIRAERHRVSAGQVPRARRLRRGLADLRGNRLPRRVLGRRGRAAFDHQSHQRRGDRAARADVHLSLEAFRPARGTHRRGRGRNQAGIEGAARTVQGPGQAARGPAAQRRHAVRHRDAAGSGLLSGHRELQPAAFGPSARLAARHAVQLLSRRLSAVRRRIARQRAAGPRHVFRRSQPQGDAGRARFPPAQRVGQPAAAVRRMGRADQAGDLRFGHARPVRVGEDRRASTSSR